MIQVQSGLKSLSLTCQIADVCSRYRLWLHVDAAWGGGLLMSQRHRNPRFCGVQRADSLTWNPHKAKNSMKELGRFCQQLRQDSKKNNMSIFCQ